MSENTGKFVPIEYAQSDQVRTRVSLPQYVNSEEIYVNLYGIGKLCRLGGIRHLDIVGLDENETSKSVPQIVGFSQNGEALAGKAIVKTVPESSSSSSSESKRHKPHSFRWVDSTIVVNTSEINQRIQNEDYYEKGVRSTKAWSNHLNKAVKSGITKEGVRHLSVGLSQHNWLMLAIQYGAMSFFELSNNPSLGGMAIRILITSAIINLADFVFENRKSEFRASLLYGPQLDRALLLYLSTLSSTLVKNKTS
jgi:hypothetical protein